MGNADTSRALVREFPGQETLWLHHRVAFLMCVRHSEGQTSPRQCDSRALEGVVRACIRVCRHVLKSSDSMGGPDAESSSSDHAVPPSPLPTCECAEELGVVELAVRELDLVTAEISSDEHKWNVDRHHRFAQLHAGFVVRFVTQRCNSMIPQVRMAPCAWARGAA